MQFQHTEDRRMLADTLDRFIRERYSLTLRERGTAELGHAPAIWNQLVELGVVGALFEPDDGGFGGEGFDIMVVFESLGGGLVAEPLLGTLMAGRALALAGHPQHDAVVAGETIVAFAHQEAGARYELEHVATRAERTADGWSLTGSKAVVVQAEAAASLLVSARTSGETDDASGISLFLIPADAAGLTIQGYPLIDGGRGADLALRDVCLPQSALVGREGGAFEIIERVVGLGIVALCAEALGAMEVVKAATLEYLHTRVQFGAPIGSNQALQHRMADILIDIEQARSAVINAAAALRDGRAGRESVLSAAKYTIGLTGIRVAEETIQMHGGIGMTQELSAAQFAKRLIMIDHQLGDLDHHLERYIELGKAA